MGKRITISETEKRNILSLYTEQQESIGILVAKKNPFKYKDFESARRKYSSDLKPGDMYYVEKFNPAEYSDWADKQLQDIEDKYFEIRQVPPLS